MIRNLFVLAFFLSASLFHTVSATPPARAHADMVVLKAWLQVSNGVTHDVIVEVEVNGVTDWGRPDRNGRVELALPANQVAMIHFRKPGHLTKSVRVDTHYAQDGTFKGKQRSISFDVVLEGNESHPGMAYAGPVGSINFLADAGDMAVSTDERLIPASRQQSIVF